MVFLFTGLVLLLVIVSLSALLGIGHHNIETKQLRDKLAAAEARHVQLESNLFDASIATLDAHNALAESERIASDLRRELSAAEDRLDAREEYIARLHANAAAAIRTLKTGD